MLKPLWILPAFSLFLLPLQGQQPTATPPAAPIAAAAAAAPNIPATPAAPVPAVNPLKSTPEVLAKAKKVYGYDCAMCHGAKGDGKGELVGDMKLTLKDYTDPTALKDMSDGQLYAAIKNGKGQMTGEGDRAKPDDVWALVLLLRSFAGK
jgi:mono/diheme cytochrome c family protein